MTKLIDAPTWLDAWKPQRPYAADDYGQGVYRTTRETALTRRHIEVNPPALVNILAVDIDRSDALFRALNGNRGVFPNVVTENPMNGHAHALWWIKEPVTTTNAARLAPMRLADAIQEGLRRMVGGDPAYNATLTKNPLHKDHPGHLITTHLYELPELNGKLTDMGFMPPRSWSRRKAADATGLGRNCSLFESARKWAYREVRHCGGDADELGRRVLARAVELNTEFPEPLPTSEVRAVAASITRWITTRSKLWRMSPEAREAHLSAQQRYRGVKSGEVRQEQAQERGQFLNVVRHSLTETGTAAETAAETGVSVRTVRDHTSQPREQYLATVQERRERIRTLAAQGMSQRQIAAQVGCSLGTVNNALRGSR